MKKVLALVVVILMLVVPLLACAKEGDSKSEAPVSQAPAKQDTVTVVVPRAMECLDDISMWSAEYLGYFDEEGIDFQMEQAYGTSDIKMVATGQAELCVPSPNLLLSSIQEDLPVICVSAYDAINIFGMAYRKDSGIDSWDDLKGKTVALGDAAWASIAAPTVLAAGLDPDKDIEYVVAGDTRYQMVNEGKIDVLFTWVSEIEQLKGQGFDFGYLDGHEVLQVFANPFVSSTKLVQENPDLLKRFLRAQNKGMYFLLQNPEAGADIVLNRFPAIQVDWAGALGAANGRNRQAFGLTEEVTNEILNVNGIGYLTDERWEKVIEGAMASGVITEKIDPSVCYTNDLLPGILSPEVRAKVEADAKAYVCTSEVYKAAHK